MISPYIYGLHDRGGEHLLNGRGWVFMTEAIGCDPQDRRSVDYSELSDQGLGTIVRLNNGYGSMGTIPTPDSYVDFARRVAHFVGNSQGCKVWQIGNEPNHEQERPMGQIIDADIYGRCYQWCRDMIKNLAGHEDDIVLLAPVAPWNDHTGDWLEYMAEMIEAAGTIDGFSLHTYTHGADPSLITSDAKMDPPFEDRLFHFRAYRDMLNVIPNHMRHLPVYITETNQGDGPWLDQNNGWVQAAYHEVNDWNHTPGTQKIQALILYRWNDHDQWQISDKQGVQQGLREAVAWGWNAVQPVDNTQGVTEAEEAQTIHIPSVSGGNVSEDAETVSGDAFERAFEIIIGFEGELSTDRQDKGNWTGCEVGKGEFKGTKYGISACTYPELDIKNLTLDDAREIYQRDYWQASGADKQGWPLSLIVFDTAVQHGPSLANKWLRETQNILEYFARRQEFYVNIETNYWNRYSKPWMRRMAQLMRLAA